MRIRDLQWKGIFIWPPEWWTTDQGGGEEGFLETVNIHKDIMVDCLCMEAYHLNSQRKGIIILENLSYLEILYNKLQEHIGKSLKEIGDMEIDLGLSLPKNGPKQLRPVIRTDVDKKKSQIDGT
jgi:hypothetical protein